MPSLDDARTLWRGDGPGGSIVRRLLPPVLSGLLVLGLLRWLGERAGLFGSTTGVLLMTLAAALVSVCLIGHFAIDLDRDAAAQRERAAELTRSSRYFELSRDLACTAGLDGVLLQLNAAWTRTLGWSEEELRSRPFLEFVHPDDRERTARETAALTQGGVTVDFCNRYALKAGGWCWLDWRAVAIIDEGVIYASAREVNARKEAELALETSQHHTRQILATARDAFVSADAVGRVLEWNPQAEELFGYSRQEALGASVGELVFPPAIHERFARGVRHDLSTGESTVLGQRMEITAAHRDGREFPIELTMTTLDTTGGLVFNTFLRDISERKAAERLVERQRRQLEEAQAVGGFGSWERDLVTGKGTWSAEMFRLLGMEPQDEPMSFDTLLELVHPDDRAAMNAARQSHGSISVEHRVRRPDGSERVLHARGEVILAEDGTPLRMLGTEQDITERRAAERAKDEFTAVVSHELRTPLTSIRGSLGLLESGVLGPLPEKGRRMVEIAVENTDRLVRLINDILDIERMNSGAVEVRQRPCDAAELIGRAVDGVRQFAADADVTLAAEVTSVTLHADPDRVLQALTNLISNAVKFSPAGSTVWLGAERCDGGVRFDVRDDGRGIPADKLESIFERFQQVDASDSREKGGTGLGLAICRAIVERHGGRIWVESQPGAGSTFSFVLPARHHPAPRAPEAAGSTGPTILVCDDDDAVVEVVSTMLQYRGFRVIGARSGAEALALATRERPDAILLDLLMPECSGRQAATALSERPETRDIPVVILSALPRSEAGGEHEWFCDWVEKPIDEDSLFAALERAIHDRRDRHAKVLIAEDDGDLAELLVAALTSDDVETLRAASGHAAIQLSQRRLPDLMVLDIGLPETDGFAVVDWLRRHEQLRRMPLLVYTGRDLDGTDRARLRLDENTEFLAKATTAPAEVGQYVRRRLAAVGASRRYEAAGSPGSTTRR